MSRSQETTAFNTAKGDQKSFDANAQTSYKDAQTGVQDYKDALSKFTAGNPFTQGGQMQTLQNQEITNTADAGAKAAGEALQSAAVRTGVNPGGAIEAEKSIADQNERNVAGEEAGATAARLGAGADYGGKVLAGSAVPQQMEAGLSGQQGSLSQGALNTETSAGQTPSFMDTLGSSFAKSLGEAPATLATAGANKLLK